MKFLTGATAEIEDYPSATAEIDISCIIKLVSCLDCTCVHVATSMCWPCVQLSLCVLRVHVVLSVV